MAPLDQVAAHAGKPAEVVTRRDVARWLLAAPDRKASLPALRQALIAGDNPLSAAFWESAETLLDRVDTGEATPGEVRAWLEATGSEPTAMIGPLVWGEEDERLPVAGRLHAELVGHLEGKVREGEVDPDRLLAGDPAAREAHIQQQLRWLREPFGGGATRLEAILDEEDEAFFDDWAAVDADAREALDEVLADVGERPCPRPALQAACDRLRAALGSGERPYDLLAASGGLTSADLPDDDEELWLTLAAGVVEPLGEPPDHYPKEMIASWYARMHADWLCAVGELARRGPGAPAEDHALAEYVVDSDIVEGEIEGDDVVGLVAHGFLLVVELWEALGAVDPDGRLTALGWWGLPEAQRRAWRPEPG